MRGGQQRQIHLHIIYLMNEHVHSFICMYHRSLLLYDEAITVYGYPYHTRVLYSHVRCRVKPHFLVRRQTVDRCYQCDHHDESRVVGN